MGYLSCRAESSISTCRSISTLTPQQPSKRADQEAAAAEDAAGERIRQFTYGELESATGNFSAAALLGRGSHGAVYKAVVRGRPVAVKRPSRRPSHVRDEVENEIDILSRLHSPALVNILGFTPPSSAAARRERLLVVEFMPNGTLYDLLHTNPNPPSWSRRLRLALQTARALLALHSADPPIIHRDIKSANVLIDHRFNARLGDFGLALRGGGGGVKSTPPAGTLGYLDPSYITPENLSTKTDVFSFGILLLEIFSGRKAIDVSHSPPTVVDWAVPLLRKGKLSPIFDPRIPPPRDAAARRQLAALASSCVRSVKERRPSMEQVVEQLKVLSKTLSARRAWNGPCSVVDTERTISRLNASELSWDPSPSPRFSIAEEVDVNGTEKGPPISIKKLPPSPGRRSRNLKELMARLDEDPVGVLGIGVQKSAISRARTLRLARDYHGGGDGSLRLRRNQTVKDDTSQSSLRCKDIDSTDGKARGHNTKDGGT